jgi:hypothetical protein
MALNLNKNDKDNKELSSSKKKGLNLSKSESLPKNKINLSKEEIYAADSQASPLEQFEEKKKSPILLIIVAVLVIGIGGYWFSQNGGSQDTSSAQPVDSLTNEVDPSQTEVDSANLSSTAAPSTTSVQPANSPDPVKESVTSEVSSPNSGNSSSLEQKAREVIDGKFGNGADRKLALGSEYKAIQAKVNALYRSRKL